MKALTLLYSAILTKYLILSVLPVHGQLRDANWNVESQPTNSAFPPLPSGIIHSRTAIAPWSKFQQKLRAEQQFASRHYTKIGDQRVPHPETVSEFKPSDSNSVDSSIPVIITLEPFGNEQPKKTVPLSKNIKQTEQFHGRSRHEGEKTLKQMYFTSAKHLEPVLPPGKAPYSTATNQNYPQRLSTRIEPVQQKPLQQNGYLAKTNYLFTNSINGQFQPQPELHPMPITLPLPEPDTFTAVQKPTAQLRGANTLQLPISAASNVMRSLPQYSRLGPAPALPFSPQSSNIANSIFAQSQIRQPPPLLGNDITSAGNNIAQFLSSEHVVEDISKLARNLLSLPGPNQQELFSSLTSALTGNKAPMLSSNAISETPSLAPSNILNAKDLFSSLAKKELLATNATNMTSVDMEKALKNFPEEQRALLEAAIQSGELETRNVLTAINDSGYETSKALKQNENRLIEWIQQNRRRPTETSGASTVPSDKLPYYGKYCGSFVEQMNAKKHFDVAGAVWAVDSRRLIISKFHFIPGSLLTENVTFWAGPANITKNAASDMTPSANGFYLQPEPIDIMTFLTKEAKASKIDAKVRTSGKEKVISSPKNATTKDESKRQKRDLFSNIYEKPLFELMEEALPASVNSDSHNKTIHLVVKGGLLKNHDLQSLLSNESSAVEPDIKNSSQTSVITTKPSNFTTPTTSSRITVAATTTTTTTASTSTLPTTKPSPTSTTTKKTTTNPIRTTTTITKLSTVAESETVKANNNGTEITPLGWYAGFQPLLLTLPENTWLKTVYWLAIRDHKRDRTVASVLIPNGPAFKIPAIVQLRPLTSNGICTVTSGPIKILDTKTIEINELTFKCDGVVAWFMIGKDILPNDGGQIVPIYNKNERTFDCDSLPQYESETVTLRLPGVLDIKDVFWFSIFSIKQGVSLSHIYLPYNDMQLPPDLNGIATPECIWRST